MLNDMITRMTLKYQKKINNVHLNFLEKESIEENLPIDIIDYCFDCIISIDNESYNMDLCFKYNENLPSEKRCLEVHDRVCKCCDCFYYLYDSAGDDYLRYCKFSKRTDNLENNPFNEFEEWSCPYFDKDDNDDINKIYRKWEKGENI